MLAINAINKLRKTSMHCNVTGKYTNFYISYRGIGRAMYLQFTGLGFESWLDTIA